MKKKYVTSGQQALNLWKDTTDILILQRFDKKDLIRLKCLTRTHISIWPGASAPRPAQSASKTQTASDFF